MKSRILIVDDKPDVRMSLAFLLNNNGFDTSDAESPQQALDMLEDSDVALILLDMNYSTDTTSGDEGLFFLERLANTGKQIPVVAMTAWSSIDLAVNAMQKGAQDFIEKPWDNKRLLQVINQQLTLAGLQRKNKGLMQQNSELQARDDFIWQSAVMAELDDKIQTLAKTDATILLTGENGTGKSSIAKRIHHLSNRNREALVTVNMGAIPESLFESEMFGHVKGAFTDARENRIGRFELANGGTLFLDEIANIPLSQQAKLLRVLESNEFEAVGSSKTLASNVRLISATNADFEELQAQGKFRPDLYYRLNTIELVVPPLRERREDLLPLANHFVQKHGRKYAKPELSLNPDVEGLLLNYDWPGNVRELSHVMERAVLLCKSNEINRGDLHLPSKASQGGDDIMPMMTLEQAERRLMEQALQQTSNVTVEAAKLLGISQSAMYRRLEKYGIKGEG